MTQNERELLNLLTLSISLKALIKMKTIFQNKKQFLSNMSKSRKLTDIFPDHILVPWAKPPTRRELLSSANHDNS